jgi:hypothetical protein
MERSASQNERENVMAYGNKNTLWVLDARRNTPELQKKVRDNQRFEMLDIAIRNVIHAKLSISVAVANGKKTEAQINVKREELVELEEALKDALKKDRNRKEEAKDRVVFVTVNFLKDAIKDSNNRLDNLEDYEHTTEEFERMYISCAEKLLSDY